MGRIASRLFSHIGQFIFGAALYGTKKKGAAPGRRTAPRLLSLTNHYITRLQGGHYPALKVYAALLLKNRNACSRSENKVGKLFITNREASSGPIPRMEAAFFAIHA